MLRPAGSPLRAGDRGTAPAPANSLGARLLPGAALAVDVTGSVLDATGSAVDVTGSTAAEDGLSGAPGRDADRLSWRVRGLCGSWVDPTLR